MQPKFFADASTFRAWLERRHADANELWLGLYKKGSGKSGISYDEAVEEALCFGWIDGLTKTVDDVSYMIRFTPRRARSNWSASNVERVKQLQREGRMREAGLAAFAARKA